MPDLPLADAVMTAAADHPDWTLRDHLHHLLDDDTAEPGDIIGAGVAQLVAWIDAGHDRAVELAAARQAALISQGLDQVKRRLADYAAEATGVAGRATGDRSRDAAHGAAVTFQAAMAVVDEVAADLQVPATPPAAAVVERVIAKLRMRQGWARGDQDRTHTPDSKPIYGAKAEAYATAIEDVRRVATDLGVPVPPDGRERG